MNKNCTTTLKIETFSANARIFFHHMRTPRDAKFCDAISGDPGITKITTKKRKTRSKWFKLFFELQRD